MNSTAPKYTSLELFLKSLSIESLDHWDHIQNSLKERKNQLKQELSSIKAKEKELEKAEAKAKKDQEKAEAKAKKDQEKATAKAKKDQEKATAKATAKAKKDQEKAEAKATAKAKKDQEKAEAKANKEVKTINTSSFKNFTSWTSGIKGQDNASQGAPTQEELDSYGGRREWKKTKWAELTKDQKDDPAAPWNCC